MVSYHYRGNAGLISRSSDEYNLDEILAMTAGTATATAV